MEVVEEARHKNRNKKKSKIYLQVDTNKSIKNGVWKENVTSNNIFFKKILRSTN